MFSRAIHEEVRHFLRDSSRPLVVVLGPTASGKTSFSIELADALRVQDGVSAEVVNADSRQLYRFLDIGTAKVSQDEMRDVPHHLLSVLDPDEPVSIAWYKEKAQACIDAIHARGHVPLLVGGSMLYMSAIIDGLVPTASDPAVRERLSQEYDADGGQALHRRLQRIDPRAAAAIPVANKRYVIRALERVESSDSAQVPAAQPCPYDLFMLGMLLPRDGLRKRIVRRVEDMFERGWPDEVRALLARGYEASCPAFQSHGYREIVAWIREGEQVEALPALMCDIATKSAQYAKRQMTWWRGDERIRWVSPRG